MKIKVLRVHNVEGYFNKQCCFYFNIKWIRKMDTQCQVSEIVRGGGFCPKNSRGGHLPPKILGGGTCPLCPPPEYAPEHC